MRKKIDREGKKSRRDLNVNANRKLGSQRKNQNLDARFPSCCLNRFTEKFDDIPNHL